MTFKELQKVVQSNQSEPDSFQLLQRLHGKPFWIFDKKQHKLEDIRTKGQCCFWHIIGCPQKDNHDMPVLPYQRTLYETLQNYKRIAILKSRGIGCTEFLLRYLAWKSITAYSTNSDSTSSPRVLILTGPNIRLSQDLVLRFKKILKYLPETEKTVAIVNNVRVEAFPSFHCSAASVYTDVRFILVDEASFWPPYQVSEMMGVVSGYISKPNSQSQIIFCSSPNKPGDLMHQIFSEQEKDSLYYRLHFDYKYGLEGQYPIYSQQEIDDAIRSREFPREMMLQFVGVVGNVFSQLSIDNATKIAYNPENINPNTKKSIGIDPGFGSSRFAIVITQYVNGKIQVIHAEEYDRPNFSEMISKVWQLKQLCGYISNIYVDAANPEVWESLKREFDERYDDQYIRDQFNFCKKYNLHIEDRMIVVPVPFSVEGAKMLQHAKWLMEETDEGGSSLIAIDKRFDKLLTGLRTAVANEYKLDKTQTSFNDLVDAFRLALIFFKRSKA